MNDAVELDAEAMRRYLAGGLWAAAAWPALDLFFLALAGGWAGSQWLLRLFPPAAAGIYLFGMLRTRRARRHPVWLYTWGGCLLYLAGLLLTQSEEWERWTPHVTAALLLGGSVVAAMRGDGVAAMMIPIPWVLWLFPRLALAGVAEPWSIIRLQHFLVAASAVLTFLFALTPFNGRRIVVALGIVAATGFCIGLAARSVSGDPGAAARVGRIWSAALPPVVVPAVIALLRALFSARGSARARSVVGRFLRDQSLARAKSY